jgi:hypothetical protein
MEVQYSHDYEGHKAGERVTVDRDEAKRLIKAGYAVPATVPAAKELRVDPETAATVKSKGA